MLDRTDADGGGDDSFDFGNVESSGDMREGSSTGDVWLPQQLMSMLSPLRLDDDEEEEEEEFRWLVIV